MVTKYFNQYDRERMMLLALLISRLPDIIDNFSSNLMDNKLRGRVKSAYKHLNAVFRGVLKDVAYEQKKQLQRAIYHHDIKVLAQSELTAEEADDSNDTFLDLMAVVQEERCYKCNLDNIEACPYRIAMLNWSVPVFNEHCEEGECPYKVVLD